MKQIEGVENGFGGPPPLSSSKGVEIRRATAVLDGLAIEDRCLATEVGSCVYDRGIALAPIVSIASENPRRSLLKQYLASIAVVFEFVNPVIPLWRPIDRGSKLGGSMNRRRVAT